jgi:hypothetical protein
MADSYTTSDLFRELGGKSYDSYQEFELEVIRLFNEHLDAFPPHYSYRDAIVWADRHGWLKATNGGLEVQLDSAAA